jgi:hypothetical protein
MSDLRTRIIAVLNVHGVELEDSRCDCGRDCFDRTHESLSDYVEHVADAVIAEMGLRQETVGLIHRWVTDWQHDKASYCLRCGIPHTTPCKRGTK